MSNYGPSYYKTKIIFHIFYVQSMIPLQIMNMFSFVVRLQTFYFSEKICYFGFALLFCIHYCSKILQIKGLYKKFVNTHVCDMSLSDVLLNRETADNDVNFFLEHIKPISITDTCIFSLQEYGNSIICFLGQ